MLLFLFLHKQVLVAIPVGKVIFEEGATNV